MAAAVSGALATLAFWCQRASYALAGEGKVPRNLGGAYYGVPTGYQGRGKPGGTAAGGLADGDVALFVTATLVMFVVARTLQFTLFAMMGRLMGVASGRGGEKRLLKFSMVLRELAYYALALFAMTRLLPEAVGLAKKSWLPAPYGNVDHLWNTGRLTEVSAEFKLVYFVACAWYSAGLIGHVLDPKKKDFYEMALHHVVTILLLTMSYMEGHLRVGAVVMVLHDASDPFLALAKLANYCKQSRRRGTVARTFFDVLANIFFVGFASVFCYTRLYIYPQVIYSAHYRGPGHFFKRTHNAVENSLVYLLTSLLPIHGFWFVLILGVVKKALMSSIDDSRSDDEEDEEEDAKAAKKKA